MKSLKMLLASLAIVALDAHPKVVNKGGHHDRRAQKFDYNRRSDDEIRQPDNAAHLRDLKRFSESSEEHIDIGFFSCKVPECMLPGIYYNFICVHYSSVEIKQNRFYIISFHIVHMLFCYSKIF